MSYRLSNLCRGDGGIHQTTYDKFRNTVLLTDDELYTDGEVVPLTMTNGNNKWDRMAAEWFLLAEEIQTDVQGAVDVLDDLLNYD